MGNILVATLGMSPGVVTKTAHHIHEDEEKGPLESVVIVYPRHKDIVNGIPEVLAPEFRGGRADAKLSDVELLDESIPRIATTDIDNWDPDMKFFIKHFINVLTKY